MRHEVLLAEGRNHDQRHAVSGDDEVAVWAGSYAAGVSGLQIRRRYAVGAVGRYGSNMVVQASTFVKGQNEDRVFPRWAAHQGVDQRSDIACARVDIVRLERSYVHQSQRHRPAPAKLLKTERQCSE